MGKLTSILSAGQKALSKAAKGLESAKGVAGIIEEETAKAVHRAKDRINSTESKSCCNEGCKCKKKSAKKAR